MEHIKTDRLHHKINVHTMEIEGEPNLIKHLWIYKDRYTSTQK
jgi:hypothetical protein